MKKIPIFEVITRDFKKHKYKYLLVIPVVIYFILFHYKSMYGIIIAFKDYIPSKGIADSKWVGTYHFTRFFKDPYFWQILRNTKTSPHCRPLSSATISRFTLRN